MLYTVRSLHLATGEVVPMHVVEVQGGLVRSLFPFDGERQSMLWVEEAFISSNPSATVYGDIKKEAQQHTCCERSFFLYSFDSSGVEELQASSPLTKLV